MEKHRPHILLSNDDGIGATGLRTLWEGLKDHADITIVAPMTEQSGKGVSVTFQGPVRVEKDTSFENTQAWKVGGTPADCVKLAIGGILSAPPDLIVSGINHGSNAGRGFFHSGTIGCVIQGILQGVPGVAFSYTCDKTPEFPHVKQYIAPIVDYIHTHPLKTGSFLNVNFPVKTIQGIKMARHGRAFWLDALRKEDHPEGHLDFHLEEQTLTLDEHPESDIALLKAGFITAVPIHVDQLTDHHHFENFRTHFDNHF